MENVKKFLHRGLVFGGFGPIICAIVFAILDASMPDFSLSGSDVLLAMISTYAIAFVQAGASVFNQIESWPLPKSLLCHLGSIYVVYILAYLVNSWIPFDIIFVLVFTGVFLLTYFIVWLIVYLVIRHTSKKMTKSLK